MPDSSDDEKPRWLGWTPSYLSDAMNHYYMIGFVHGATTVMVSGVLVYLLRR